MLSLTTTLLLKGLENPLFRTKESATILNSSSLYKQINSRNNSRQWISVTNDVWAYLLVGLLLTLHWDRQSHFSAGLADAVHSGMDLSLPPSASLTLSIHSLAAATPSTRQRRPSHRKGNSQVRSKEGRWGRGKVRGGGGKTSKKRIIEENQVAMTTMLYSVLSAHIIYRCQIWSPCYFPRFSEYLKLPPPPTRTHTQNTPPAPLRFITSSFPSFSQLVARSSCLMYTAMNACLWPANETRKWQRLLNLTQLQTHRDKQQNRF